MRGGWLGGALARLAAPWTLRPHSPTADLYFLNACRDWVGPGRPVARLGPGVFASARTLVVMRHAGLAGPLPRRERLFWLIDDDVEAALADPGLPAGHRLKLALHERRDGARLRAAGAEVVASSAALLASCAGGRGHLLRPHWSEPLADLAHHGAGPVRLAYLGSAVHAGDLAFLAPVLLRLLAAHPAAELHLAANHAAGPLAGHPRVVRIGGTRWPDWRARLPARRFDIALYPLLDTAANRARSVNKIVEHAIVGAAGVYSDTWPEAARIARRGAGLVLPNAAAAWESAVAALMADAGGRQAIAARARRLASDLNHPGLQREFWRHAFALEPSDRAT